MHVEAELDEDDSDCWSSDAEVVSEKRKNNNNFRSTRLFKNT